MINLVFSGRKTLLLVGFIMAFVGPIKAGNTHLTGGELTYICLGENAEGTYDYQLSLQLFRECTPHFPPIEFDENVTLSIFERSTATLFTQLTLDRGPIAELDVSQADACYDIPEEFCYETTLYEGQITLPESAEGFTISWGRCCHDPFISNIQFPEETGYVFQAVIPKTSMCNSSPVFNEIAPLIVCSGDNLDLDFSAIDPDGDSLIYELVTPLAAGSSSDVFPENLQPPYEMVAWEAGYSTLNPIPSNPSLTLNRFTGRFSGQPNEASEYVLAVKVSEYRDGVFLGAIVRDVQLVILNCLLNNPPKIVRPDHPRRAGDTLFFYLGETTCFTFNFTDESASGIGPDTLSISASGEVLGQGAMPPPYATFNDAVNVVSPYAADFCWAPPCDFSGPMLSKAYFVAEDRNPCPFPNKTIDSLWVKVIPDAASAPVLDCVTPLSGNQVEISWNPLISSQSEGFDAYILFRKAGLNWQEIASINAIEQSNYTDNVDENAFEQIYCYTLAVQKNCPTLFRGENATAICTDDTCNTFVETDLPNIFTPNGDGVNDVFYYNTPAGSVAEFLVFDRWGQLIFNSKSAPIIWDGRTNTGNAAKDGVYFFTIRGTHLSGAVFERKGTVTVVR